MRIRAVGGLRHPLVSLEDGEETEVEEELGRFLLTQGWVVDADTGEFVEPERREVTLEVHDTLGIMKSVMEGE